ncbi:hypothetical protein BOTBODRAFT_47549 [Botryobasidium botryosum FD-172 SS1]|uniref:Uncharacterized protein n=1 Tax=Botryobasidium botryosum (strain FD-172 SS1) TaxID=930990 RepID=A0A067M495_BOTB1|nr:hypothetical protein BOTBODRAFT_47549 [Botryobasidium botryosum FD-172 SS1]
MSSSGDRQHDFDADLYSYLTSYLFAPNDPLVQAVLYGQFTEKNLSRAPLPFVQNTSKFKGATKSPISKLNLSSKPTFAGEVASVPPASLEELMAAAGTATTLSLISKSSPPEDNYDASFGFYGAAPALASVSSVVSTASTALTCVDPLSSFAETGKNLVTDPDSPPFFLSFPEFKHLAGTPDGGKSKSGKAQLVVSADAVAADPFVDDFSVPSGWNPSDAPSFRLMGSANVAPIGLCGDDDSTSPLGWQPEAPTAAPSTPSPVGSKNTSTHTAVSLSGWEESIASKPFSFAVDPGALQLAGTGLVPSTSMPSLLRNRYTIETPRVQKSQKRKRGEEAEAEEGGNTPWIFSPSSQAGQAAAGASTTAKIVAAAPIARTSAASPPRAASVLARASPYATPEKRRSPVHQLSEQEMIAQLSSDSWHPKTPPTPILRRFRHAGASAMLASPSILNSAKRSRVAL